MLHYILNKAENWHIFAKEQRENKVCTWIELVNSTSITSSHCRSSHCLCSKPTAAGAVPPWACPRPPAAASWPPACLSHSPPAAPPPPRPTPRLDPRPPRCSQWRPRPRWGRRCQLCTWHWARSQEPRILCNKIIVHIDNTIPIIIEYDDTHLKQKVWHRLGHPYTAAGLVYQPRSIAILIGCVAGPRPHLH